MRQRPVRTMVVVDLGELIEKGLQLRDVRGLLGLGSEPLLQGLLEPFDFALGLWVVWLAVLLGDVQLA